MRKKKVGGIPIPYLFVCQEYVGDVLSKCGWNGISSLWAVEHRVIQSANTTLVLSGIARCICPFRKCKNQCNFTAYNPGFSDPHPYPVSSVWSKGA